LSIQAYDLQVGDHDSQRDARVSVTALALAIAGSAAACLIVLTAGRLVWHLLLEAFNSWR
jgi:hypothetical protein